MAQLLSNLPIGSKIKFGKHSVEGETPWTITWLIVSKRNNLVTLLTEKVIDFRAFDAVEPNSPVTVYRENGNNRYIHSNLGQWLNSEAVAGQWYSPTHTHDQAPSLDYVQGGTPYVNRPGFLNNFTITERDAILMVSVVTGSDVLSQKVFVPSTSEVEGEWEYLNSNESRKCIADSQAYRYTNGNVGSYDTAMSWWLRDAAENGSIVPCVYPQGGVSGRSGGIYASSGVMGVRPAINLTPTLSVSDSTDNEGYYNIVWNSAPSAPSGIFAPAIYGGKSNVIMWGTSTDFDGDVITYTLECSIDGGNYIEVYRGLISNYAHLVPFGTSTVIYRVKATDPSDFNSEYIVSDTLNVINNNAPTISGADTNLGVKTDDFTGTYTITDANSDVVTVTEAIDGVRIRSLVVPLGEEITYGVTESTWLALPNGSHTLTISATDGIDTTVRTIVFTKLVDKFTIQNSTPWQSSTMPTRIMLVVTRNIPSTSTFKVEVCNNGFDASPTWEDCTDAVKSGLVHVMTNKTKTATNWGVLVKVTVERNGATGACYVSAIGGNFE